MLVAPPLLDADSDIWTVLFVGAALVGTTLISLYKNWFWLPGFAFVLSYPQVVNFLSSGPQTVLRLATVFGYWLLNMIASGGEEFRFRSRRLRPTSASLVLANTVFIISAGFEVLNGDLSQWRGFYLLVVTLSYFLIGAYFLLDEGEFHPFGLLVTGAGIVALTIAIPVQIGGSTVPVAWSAEATALAWKFSRRNHYYSAAMAIFIGLLALIHFVTIDYPFWERGS